MDIKDVDAYIVALLDITDNNYCEAIKIVCSHIVLSQSTLKEKDKHIDKI